MLVSFTLLVEPPEASYSVNPALIAATTSAVLDAPSLRTWTVMVLVPLSYEAVVDVASAMITTLTPFQAVPVAAAVTVSVSPASTNVPEAATAGASVPPVVT